MPRWVLVEAKPSGFVMVKGDGSVYLKASSEATTASVGGDEWDVVSIIGMEIGGVDQSLGSRWEIRRENNTDIVFEMVDKDSTVDWGVPLKMIVKRQELVDVVSLLMI